MKNKIAIIKAHGKDIISSLRTKGFAETFKKYWRQFALCLAVLIVIIGIISAICVGISHATAKDADDTQQGETILSDMTYTPKEITLEVDKSASEEIIDTHAELVIKGVGNVSEDKTAQSVASEGENMYIHYSVKFNKTESGNAEYPLPQATVFGTKDDTVTIPTTTATVFDGKEHYDATAFVPECSRTYDCYVTFSADGISDTYIQIVNSDGNITRLVW